MAAGNRNSTLSANNIHDQYWGLLDLRFTGWLFAIMLIPTGIADRESRSAFCLGSKLSAVITWVCRLRPLIGPWEKGEDLIGVFKGIYFLITLSRIIKAAPEHFGYCLPQSCIRLGGGDLGGIIPFCHCGPQGSNPLPNRVVE